MATQNVTLNGSTSFSAFGESYSWVGERIEAVFFDNSGSATADQLNMSLAGADWAVRRFEIEGSSASAPLNLTVNDSNDGLFRRIDRMQIGDFSNVTINLLSAQIRHIEGANGSVVLNLGSGSLQSAQFWDSSSVTVTMGSGSVDTMFMSNAGPNVFNGGSGWLNFLEMGEGTNTFTGGSGNFGTIRAWGATNTMTFQTGGDAIVMGDGVNRLTLNDGFFGAITSYSGTNTITVGAEAEVRSIGFSGGVDVVTVRGSVEQIQLGSNNDRLIVQDDGTAEQALLGSGNNIVTMTGGWIGSLRMNEGNDTVTLTGAEIDALNLGDGTNRLTINAGAQVNSLIAGGDETITLRGDGRILAIKMDRGINVLTSDTGFIESFVSYAARNTLTIGTGGIGEILIMGSPAAQTINATGWVGSLQVYSGSLTGVLATTITLGDGGAGYIQTSKGNDVITGGDGDVESISTWDGSDRVTLGSGVTQSVLTGTGNDTVTTGLGWVESIRSGDGNDLVVIGRGDAGSVGTGEGNDTVNATNGRAGHIDTGDGNDRVTLGGGGALFVSLGDGADLIVLDRFDVPEWGGQIIGGGGIDTANLTAFATALHVTLNNWGAFQNVGAPGGAGSPPAFGYVALTQVENLIGSAFADWIEGSDDANVLTGLGGADSLSGLDGDDRLDGGLGNDSLTGGLGIDRFVFATGGGTDRIEDFTTGEDKVELRQADALSDLTFTQQGTDVRVVFGTWTGIFEDITVAELRLASNFLF